MYMYLQVYKAVAVIYMMKLCVKFITYILSTVIKEIYFELRTWIY